jgi:hypothetical protein
MGGMPSQIPRAGFPALDGAIQASRGQKLAIRREGEGADSSLVSGMEPEEVAGVSVPESDLTLFASGCDLASIGGEPHHSHRFGVA